MSMASCSPTPDSPAGTPFENPAASTHWEVVVLVAARNEAAHLPCLRQALEEQQITGARLSWWLVDDGSIDGGVKTQAEAPLAPGRALTELCTLQQAPAGKLAALALGVEAVLESRCSTLDRCVLLFTDADCQPGPQWAARHLKAHQQGAQVVAGHVQVHGRDETGKASSLPLLRRFENAVSSLQVALGCARGRAPFTRGANWSVRLDLLRRAGGLRGLEHLPSGDDVHLVRRLSLHQACFRFLPEKEARVASVESLVSSAAQARRRYGKLGELPYVEQLRQGALFAALGLQVALLLVGVFLPGGLWRWPLLTLGVVGVMTQLVLSRGLRLLGETQAAHLALPLALRLALHALWYSLRGSLGGYAWKDAGSAPVERAP